MAKINGRVMTSLVVDPPTGRVPTLPEITKARQANATPRADNFEERHLNERCLVHTAGPPMVGGGLGLNPYLQIVQTSRLRDVVCGGRKYRPHHSNGKA